MLPAIQTTSTIVSTNVFMVLSLSENKISNITFLSGAVVVVIA